MTPRGGLGAHWVADDSGPGRTSEGVTPSEALGGWGRPHAGRIPTLITHHRGEGLEEAESCTVGSARSVTLADTAAPLIFHTALANCWLYLSTISGQPSFSGLHIAMPTPPRISTTYIYIYIYFNLSSLILQALFYMYSGVILCALTYMSPYIFPLTSSTVWWSKGGVVAPSGLGSRERGRKGDCVIPGWTPLPAIPSCTQLPAVPPPCRRLAHNQHRSPSTHTLFYSPNTSKIHAKTSQVATTILP